MGNKNQISAEQAIDMVMGWLDTVEVKGHTSIRAMAQSIDLLAKVKVFLIEQNKPQEEPVVTLEPVVPEESASKGG